MRRYIGRDTEQFLHEFWNFARTNYTLDDYDAVVSYMPHRGLSNTFVDRTVSPTLSTSSSSDDSDVRVLAATIAARPTIQISDMPGPSSVAQALRLNTSNEQTSIYVITSSSESENECEVIGYVKPRHERTPELIELLSTDGEVEDGEIVPEQQAQPTLHEPTPSTSQSILNDELDVFRPVALSHSSISSAASSSNRRTRNFAENLVKAQVYEYLNTSLSSDSSSSDSDYNPTRSSKTSRKHKSKKSSKKCSKKSRKSSGKRAKSTATRSKRLSTCSTSEDEDYCESKRRLSNSDKEEKSRKRKKTKKSSKSSKKSCKYFSDSSSDDDISEDTNTSSIPVGQYLIFDAPHFNLESRQNNERNNDSISSSESEYGLNRRKIYKKITRRRSRSK